jgi:hypothetical protein
MSFYCTPDGSIWQTSSHDPLFFHRLSGPNSEGDFRPQSLDEVLKHWGPLSIYDPVAEVAKVLVEAMVSAGWHRTAAEPDALKMAKEVFRMGYDIKSREEES